MKDAEGRILEHDVIGIARCHRLTITIGESRVERVDNVCSHGGHPMSTGGATILGAGYLLILIYLVASLFKPRNAPANPWGATGLEWEIPSPPTTFNFETDPIVTEDAYNYAGRARKAGEN